MLIDGKKTISIEYSNEPASPIRIIDQRLLPHKVVWETLKTSEDVAVAISEMHLRGAPLIGAAAGFGVVFALKESLSEVDFQAAFNAKISRLKNTRPTAVNLSYAINSVLSSVTGSHKEAALLEKGWRGALKIVEDDIEQCRQIGLHGLKIIKEIYEKKKDTVQILTHCNAGWLACLDWGTATSPMYHAQIEDIPIHVWVDETRPRNQGAKLTAFELEQQNIPYTVVCDNTGGHLMQHKMVDLVLVGSDRTTISGDVANKIGTYLKALAARDNGIPFYAALPSTTFDSTISDGVKEIPIEEREALEVKEMDGLCEGQIKSVLVTPQKAAACNYGFDVTPARLVSGIITERGVTAANRESILAMFPEMGPS